MSKKVLKIASRRPMLLALIVMATITIGLLFSGRAQSSSVLIGAQSSAKSSSQYGAPDPAPNDEDCDNPTTTTICASAAQLVLSSVSMSPSASNGAPYDSIVCVGGTITASLSWFAISSTNMATTCHTCDGSRPTNYCDAPVISAGAMPCNITNKWTWTRDNSGGICAVGGYTLTGGIGGTNGLADSVVFSCTNATTGSAGFANLSAQMPSNPAGCGAVVANGTNFISPRSFAFVDVADLSAQGGYTPISDDGTNKVYRVCVVPADASVTNITVLATPNPQMDAQWLPSGWSLLAGNVSNKVTCLVDITTPGTNAMVCFAGTKSYKSVTIIVQQGTLRLANPVVFVNNDDDNGDGIPDKDDPTSDPGSYVAGEGDLMQIGLNLQCVDPMQTVTLSVNQQQSGTGGIRVWPNATRGPGSPLLDNGNVNMLSTNWPASQMPTNLWVEGVSQSASVGDVQLSLGIDGGCGITTNLTVISAQLGVDINRNGSVSYGSTSATNPFCFWLNDNHDGYGTIGLHSVQEDLGGSDDLSSTSITCTRDLEDYTRLAIQIQGPSQIQQQLTNGDIVVKLESDGPQIRVYQQAGSGLDYLSVSNIAQQQISAPYKTSIGTIGDPMPACLWTNSTTANLLFDGIGAGNDKVKVVLYARDGTTKIGEGQPLYLKLQTAKDMYDTWTVSNSTSSTASGSSVYDSSSPETGQYILFVHGMGMSDGADGDKVHFANTAYKRLWWQNYKGRFGAFDWPCLGIGSYDASELIAWQSATALSNKLADLNAAYPGNVYLFAHSQGNVIAGEALRLLNGTTNGVQAYVACQAAVSAHAYDPSTTQWTPHIGTYNTPDDYSNYPPTGVNYFNGVTSGGSEANFYNTNDFALRWWVRKQRLKPDRISGYGYSGTSYYSDYGFTTLSYPADRYTIFARCVQSHSLALGATPGVLASSLDLTGVWGTDPFETNPSKLFSAHLWHSGEFYFSTVEQSGWWANLMDSLHLH